MKSTMSTVGGLACLVACVVLTVLLVGCPPPLPRGAVRPPLAADLAVFDAVLVAAGPLATRRCYDERQSRLVVVDADDATMRRGVGYCASDSDTCVATSTFSDPEERQMARARAGCLLGMCAGGSTVWEQDDVWPANLGRWRAVIYVSAYEDVETRRRLVLHEAVHWIGGCSDTGSDYRHAREELWGPEGLERRAAAIIWAP